MLNGEVIWQANDSSFLKSTHAFSLSLLRFLSLPFSSSLSFFLPLILCVEDSVTRFGKISPLWQNV